MKEHNESFFDLLFRDESPDEGYSLLGIALLASLAFHLLFITCVKIKSFPVENRVSLTPPTIVTFDTSESSVLVSSLESDDDLNPLSPKNFGFCHSIISEQVPVNSLSQHLFRSLSMALDEKDHEGIASVTEINTSTPLLFPVEVPKIYPITIHCSEELANLTLTHDGSDLFIRPYLECLFAAPSISDKKNSCSYEVTVQGINGMIINLIPLQPPEDNRLETIAKAFLEKIQFSSSPGVETLQGTIVLEFSCSYDLLTLLIQ